MPPRITHEDLFWREWAGVYGANIGFPAWKKWAGNMKLARSILDGSFFWWNKLKTSPDISNIPEVLKNLRTSVQWPCCSLLNWEKI